MLSGGYLAYLVRLYTQTRRAQRLPITMKSYRTRITSAQEEQEDKTQPQTVSHCVQPITEWSINAGSLTCAESLKYFKAGSKWRDGAGITPEISGWTVKTMPQVCSEVSRLTYNPSQYSIHKRDERSSMEKLFARGTRA